MSSWSLIEKLLPKLSSSDPSSLTSMAFSMCTCRLPTQNQLASQMSQVSTLWCKAKFSFLFKVHDAQVANNLLNHNCFNIDHDRQDPNKSYHYKKRILMKKIPRNKILPPRWNLLCLSKKATNTMAFYYSIKSCKKIKGNPHKVCFTLLSLPLIHSLDHHHSQLWLL